MISISDTKECSKCHAIKPRSEFYSRGKSNPHQTSECKECMKIRAKHQPKRNQQVSTVKSENDVIQVLKHNGIAALPGKALGHKWGDVVAWGCILIEVKSSTLINGQFNFGFTSAQRRERLRGEFIALVADWGDHHDYYLFPVTHPMFYNADGQLKTAVGWTPNRGSAGRPAPITDDERESYRDAWYQIEYRRIEIIKELKLGQ